MDDNVCTPNSSACRFSPDHITVSSETSVIWRNNGTFLHTVTANSTANPGLPSFDSGTILRFSSYTLILREPGIYHYYCSIHPWMKGVVNVVRMSEPSPLQPPQPSIIRVKLAGDVGWNVKGLDSETAVLDVAHMVNVSLSPSPGVTFTPLSESGSFEEAIDLKTRQVSSGTATSILMGLLSSILRGGGIMPFGGMSTATSQMTLIRPVSDVGTGMGMSSDRPVYTQWWVNGPLNRGSPVQILMGWASVTGDESVDTHIDGLGTRPAWIVTSQFSQSFTANDPYGGSSSTMLSFDLLWSYGKNSDVLLRDNSTVKLSVLSVNRQTVFVYNPCAPTGWCPVYAEVMVTREMTATLSLALRLASTDLNLRARTRQGSTAQSPLDSLAALPWMPLGALGAVAGALVGSGIWVVYRGRRKPGLDVPGILPT